MVKTISLSIYLLTIIAYSQSHLRSYSNSLSDIANLNLAQAHINLSKIQPKDSVELKINKLLLSYTAYLKNGHEFEIKFSDSTNNSTKKLLWLNSISHTIYSDKSSIQEKRSTEILHKHYKKGVNLALETNDNALIFFSVKKMIYHLFYNEHNREELPYYFDKLKKHSTSELGMLWYDYYKYRYDALIESKNKINELKNNLNLLKSQKAKFLLANYHQHIGLHYTDFTKYQKTSRYHLELAKKLFDSINFINQNQYIFQSYANLGMVSYREGNYMEALNIFKTAEEIKISNKRLDYLANIERWKSRCFIAINNYKGATECLQRREFLLDSLGKVKHSLAMKENETKYRVKDKEKQITIEQQKKELNRNIAIGLGTSLGLASVIAFLLFKNTRKKQKLAEQEKTLETQKLATVLKEQELLSIDAMIEGQEKERQRIANDLHDDLGGLMATVKLHFNALKEKQTPELYTKTNTLIDEAYNKVRSVAHAKNSGVIAKQGLLKAITEMTDKISALNKITIDVIDHGLENRLENSLELTIFRIVQELITNIIKHANATEATIHITNHDDSLNIMVEDNGIGFSPSQITKTKKGMGISSIDKRVEHLNGNMTIESEPNKGTTIIIDIPL